LNKEGMVAAVSLKCGSRQNHKEGRNCFKGAAR
jgi:hypothetical protein